MEQLRKNPSPKPLPSKKGKTYPKAIRDFSPSSDVKVEVPNGRCSRTVKPKAKEILSHSTKPSSIAVKRISNTSVPKFTNLADVKDKETENREEFPVVSIELIKDVSLEPVKDVITLEKMLGSSNDPVVTSQGVYFWRKRCKFSQWFPCKFTGPDGFVYANTEQWMMAGKARLFKDSEVLDRILNATNPKQIWRLGRSVSNFDEAIWKSNRERIVLEGNVLKFSQDKLLARALFATGDKLLVEASAQDKIWGIRMDPKTASRSSKSQWKGLNLLGKALMETRQILRSAVSKN